MRQTKIKCLGPGLEELCLGREELRAVNKIVSNFPGSSGFYGNGTESKIQYSMEGSEIF